jgi:hypothetical protein
VSAFGIGSDLWRVDVVLRRDGAADYEKAEVLELLASWLEDLPTSPGEEPLPDVVSTFSFDMEPPEGSLGFSCWVRADTVGSAAQAGYDVVQRACAQVTGQPHRLWDLRVLPRSAITPRANLGTPLVRVEPRPSRWRRRHS